MPHQYPDPVESSRRLRQQLTFWVGVVAIVLGVAAVVLNLAVGGPSHVGPVVTVVIGIGCVVLGRRQAGADSRPAVADGDWHTPRREERIDRYVRGTPFARLRWYYCLALSLGLVGGSLAAFLFAGLHHDTALVGLGIVLVPPAWFMTWITWVSRSVLRP